MWAFLFKSFLRLMKVAVIFYLCLLATWYFMQRKMIYLPDKKRPVAPAVAEIAVVHTKDALELQGWFFPPRNNLQTIVYFHGNAVGMKDHMIKINRYLDKGYGVLLTEYRGYGGNPGHPSEAGFYLDAHAFIDWLIEEKDVPFSEMVLYGESIGSGVVLEMAKQYDERSMHPYAVVLEAPFLSLLQMSRRRHFYVPVDWLLLDRFMNTEKMVSVRVPLLVINGEKDEFIPYTDGRTLYDLAQEPKTYIMIPEGDHNGLHFRGLQKYVLDFLENIPSSDMDNNGSEAAEE